MQLGQLYQETIRKFRQAGIENAESDAAQLLGHCLGLTRSLLFLHSQDVLSGRQLEHCRELIDRRTSREPLHYITGSREFWSLDFKVSPAVLIPRPETEFLLEQVLQTLDRMGFGGGPVLDMCTGSGVIAVVLARELRVREVVAVDRSPEALEIAAENIRRHGKEEEIGLVCSDLFAALDPRRRFELIVANPPYVPAGELAGLQPEVRNWEPVGALAAGREGLDTIARLAYEVPEYLAPGGWVFLEIGSDQKKAVQSIFANQGRGVYDLLEILDDWSGKPRVLKARRRG